MNHQIANILKDYLSVLPFVDKLSGLVQAVQINVPSQEGHVLKSFPVSCDITHTECYDGHYLDLCPESSKKTVIYFEDRGVRFIRRSGARNEYKSTLRLVCWINIQRLLNEACFGNITCSVSSKVIKQILCVFPSIPVDIDPFERVYPVVVSEEIRSNAIFSAYTYDDLRQYLLYPYDFFALTIETTFSICMDCEKLEPIKRDVGYAEYVRPVTLLAGEETDVTTPLTEEPYNIMILDGEGNNITAGLQVRFELIGGVYHVFIYSVNAIDVKIKILY